MPLAFDSLSHGTIAFGFFNIDSDMLILDCRFFFATDFCHNIIDLAENGKPGPYTAQWEVYQILNPADIGDLMGAIHGIHFSGFIGEVYRRFPFPRQPEAFKQKPEGCHTQALMRTLIQRFAESVQIPFFIDPDLPEVCIGPYRFTRAVFHELIRYVWQGGYPRWKDERRPPCVTAMKKAIDLTSCPMLKELRLSD
ncbi:MAG: hypothetical protein J7M32_11790 [Deltaproteobacteria bacterium]|nr:hypothetical protein [Deltaproteobacteria bacterium]